MRALIFENTLQFKNDYPVPNIKDDDALIRVSYAGICNTDLEITKGYMGFQGILGHEFVGTVEKSSNKEIEGKRVVGDINIACCKCFYCAHQMSVHCPQRSVLGILKRDGVFAEYTTLPLKNIHVIPDSVSDEEAVFIEPLAAAFEILEQVDISPEDKVCIMGDGKLGILIAQVVSLTKCNLTAVGNHKDKLSILDNVGICTRLSSDLSDDQFDIVVDCTGSESGIKTALHIVKPRGRIILKTTVAKQSTVDLNAIVINEISLIGSRCGPFAPAIEALSTKKINLLPLISREFKLEDGLEAFQYAARKEALKVLLKIT